MSCLYKWRILFIEKCWRDKIQKKSNNIERMEFGRTTRTVTTAQARLIFEIEKTFSAWIKKFSSSSSPT